MHYTGSFEKILFSTHNKTYFDEKVDACSPSMPLPFAMMRVFAVLYPSQLTKLTSWIPQIPTGIFFVGLLQYEAIAEQKPTLAKAYNFMRVPLL
jgi:hypothetical protein